VNDGTETIDEAGLLELKKLFGVYVFEILGLKNESVENKDEQLSSELMNLIISLRNEAKLRKDFTASDKIRDELKKAGVILKDTKDGSKWERI
jgi:cysteinyl-tRNA synthetase